MKHFVILCICSLWAISVQCKAAYKLKITRAEIARYNKEYIDCRMWITKLGWHTNAINGEFILYKLPQDTQVKIKGYEFLSNEYRPFAINFERSLCSYMTLEHRMAYLDFVKIGAHMPEPRCPVKPGNYSFANLTLNVDNYPPGLPFRNWLLTIEFSYGPVEIFLMKICGTLDRDAFIREQYS